MIVGVSPRKAALTLYGVYNDYAPADPLFDELGPHTTGKGCLYLKRLSDVDPAILESLIRNAWNRAGVAQADLTTMPAELAPWLTFALAVVVVAVVAVLLTVVVTIPFRIIARRASGTHDSSGASADRSACWCSTIGLLVALQFFPDQGWRDILVQAGKILVIASAAWMLAAVIGFLFSRADAALPDGRRRQSRRAASAHADGDPAARDQRGDRRRRHRGHPADLPGGRGARGEPARLGGNPERRRRHRRPVDARQPVRRAAAGVLGCDPRRRRRGGRRGVGPDRGDHPHLRRRAHLGRSPPRAPVDHLHDAVVRELDAPRQRVARVDLLRRRLARQPGADARAPPSGAGDRAALGRPRLGAAGDGCGRRVRQRAHPRDRGELRRAVGPALQRPGSDGRVAASGRRGGPASHPGGARRAGRLDRRPDPRRPPTARACSAGVPRRRTAAQAFTQAIPIDEEPQPES